MREMKNLKIKIDINKWDVENKIKSVQKVIEKVNFDIYLIKLYLLK